MIPILGFAPDMDQTTPGVVGYLPSFSGPEGYIPTENGMKAVENFETRGIAALTGEVPYGAALVRNLAGTATLYVGTQTKLYKLNGTSWTDVTGTAPALSSTSRWSFAQFGNDTLATAIDEQLHKATTGAFAAVAGAPNAQIVLGGKDFVMLLHTNEGTYGDQTDRWWCSGFQDDTTWTPAVSTQCTTGRLIEGEGPITAGAVLGDDFIVCKKKAIFHGRYVGPPVVWDFTRVPGNHGASGQDSIVVLGDRLLIAGDEDVVIYDGARPVSVAEGKIRKYYKDAVTPQYSYRNIALLDSRVSCVYIFLYANDTSGATGASKIVCVNTNTYKWGLLDSTFGGGGAYMQYENSVYETVPAQMSAGSGTQLLTLTGTPGTRSFHTWKIGDPARDTHLSALDVLISGSPSSAVASGSTNTKLSGSDFLWSAGAASVALDDDRFDMRQTGRWHRVVIETIGNCEITGVMPRLKPEGAR